MKKILAFFVLASLVSIFLLNAQPADTEPQDDAEIASLADTASVVLTNIIVDDFEDAGAWQGEMPRDLGIIKIQAREGGAGEVKPDENQTYYCLGAKVSFFKTGPSWFSISPPREIPIKGLCQSLSVWVCGRSFSHKLKAIMRDFNGELRFTSFNKLIFAGWKKLEARVPDNVIQDNYKLFSSDRPRGIKFVSFVVDCAQDETVGEYYMYLDNLEARSDVFYEVPENQIPHNMQDNW
jgi:hypothetical protein